MYTHTFSLYHLTATHGALLQNTPRTVDHDNVALHSLRNVMDKGEHVLSPVLWVGPKASAGKSRICKY